LVQYLDEWGIFGVAFGGGEPFLYSYLQEIVQYVWTQTKLDTSITTNGYAATAEQISALEGYVSEVRVSIRSLDDCAQLSKFLGRGFEVGVNLLLYRDNMTTLVDIVEQCKDLGVGDFLVNSFAAVGQGAAFVDKVPIETDFSEFSKKVIGRYVGSGLTFKVSGRLAASLEPYLDCGFVPFHSEERGQILSITFDGKLKPTSLSSEAYPFQNETQIADIYRQKIALTPK
jgi:MoaA/NifB/PqqE/SkfB family radical SAM enzyme